VFNKGHFCDVKCKIVDGMATATLPRGVMTEVAVNIFIQQCHSIGNERDVIWSNTLVKCILAYKGISRKRKVKREFGNTWDIQGRLWWLASESRNIRLNQSLSHGAEKTIHPKCPRIRSGCCYCLMGGENDTNSDDSQRMGETVTNKAVEFLYIACKWR